MRYRALKSLPAAILTASLTFLTGNNGARAAEPLDQLYKAAQDAGETSLTIYNPSATSNKMLFDAFKARFPKIRFSAVDLIGPALIARLDAEFASSGPQASVVMNSEPDQLVLANKGYLAAYKPEGAAALPAQYVGKDEMWVDYGLTIGGMYYNTNKVSAADAPQSYAELVTDKWKGRLATGTLRSASGTSQAFTALIRDGIIDQEWIKGLAQSGIFISPTVSAAVQAVASGQSDVGIDIPIYFFENARQQGAPIAFVFPKEGVTSIALGIAKFKDASNQASADLFLAWMFSAEAQSILAEMGLQGTMPDAPKSPKIPQGREISFHPIDWKTLEKEYPKQLEIYQAEFKN
ncbi:iron(III) transport system substrate-binding protein [Agrobacterium pusense]|uniref:ABC transporter substrate-binding protein n=1 Tax=Agrobacterium pusense TaxID=648995 RepID=UPI0028572A0B|nr:extracellular solute-binding protein [Agrobacterium pusense]MDR6192929.1 iron(III) transport system substrate-binding protein [Agrobacterium pusense]